VFSNLGLHVIKNPAGTFSFVGSIPLVLAVLVEPTKADIMAGRYFQDPDGNIRGYKFPVFTTEEAARKFAASKDQEVIQ
jgi:hypothetical protein